MIAFIQTTLEADKISRLEQLPYWNWGVFNDAWEKNYQRYLNFLKSGKQLKDDKILTHWVRKQRSEFKSGRISQERIERMEAIHGWFWSPHEKSWWDKFDRLKAHIDEYDELPPPQSSMGHWIYAQRNRYREGNLPLDRFQALSSLPKQII